MRHPGGLLFHRVVPGRALVLQSLRVQVTIMNSTTASAGPYADAEHTWLVGSNRPILAKVRPYRCALYSSIEVNADHPASWMLLASRVPATHRSSAYTAWLSRMIAVEVLWRLSVTSACARATPGPCFLGRMAGPLGGGLPDRRGSSRPYRIRRPTGAPDSRPAAAVLPRLRPSPAPACLMHQPRRPVRAADPCL
jgi:hypothetical protein